MGETWTEQVSCWGQEAFLLQHGVRPPGGLLTASVCTGQGPGSSEGERKVGRLRKSLYLPGGGPTPGKGGGPCWMCLHCWRW